tara:strand:+ start:597 stop:893 length:297 start_codon:yes stop_codon:yes gene_type:complete
MNIFIFTFKLFIFLLVFFNLTSIAFGQKCIFLKKVEYLEDKILSSVTEYKCYSGSNGIKKNKKILVLNNFLPKKKFVKKRKRQRPISFSQIRNTVLGN